MGSNNNYHMGLLEGRAKRLNELLEMAAPTDMIWKEIVLITEAARPFAPKSWDYGSWGQSPQGSQNEAFQGEYQSKCATG